MNTDGGGVIGFERGDFVLDDSGFANNGVIVWEWAITELAGSLLLEAFALSTVPYPAESYAGVVDYALHATRNITETVMQTTPLAETDSAPKHDAKGSLVGNTEAEGHNLQLIGGYYGLDMESRSSQSGYDYQLESRGGYAGVRVASSESLSYGGFLAVDKGSVDSAGLDLDAEGRVAGVFAHYRASETTGLWVNLSYGHFSFDGERHLLGSSLTLDVRRQGRANWNRGGLRCLQT